MIVSLRGTCVAHQGETLVVEVGGVGLKVTCTPSAMAAARVGNACRLATALIVREDGWSLYGFADADERGLFDQLQTVTGVGPRMALTTVGSLGTIELVRAITTADIRRLTAVPGVGKKTAERMVLELREKVGPTPPAAETGTPPSLREDVLGGWQRQVLDGLVGLGWQNRDAQEAVAGVATEVAQGTIDTADVAALLRLALTRLDRV